MKGVKLTSDRAEGCRNNVVGVNPSAISFGLDFSPASDPPKPFGPTEARKKLLQKGFSDGDTDEAEFVISRISYQHASEYFDLFKDEDGAMSRQATVRMLHRLILFDRKLQALLIEYIGLFELQFRAQYSYCLTEKRGAFAHRNPKNFKDTKHFKSFLYGYEKEYKRQLQNGNFEIIRANERYGDAPTWLAVEMISFSSLSKLYSNTRSKEVRESVAKSFRACSEEMVSWVRAISCVRNVCAHFGRLCGKKLVSMPKRIPGVKGDNGNPFYIVLLLLYMLGGSEFFFNDDSLAYTMHLLQETVNFFRKYSDVLELAKIPPEWFSQITDKKVLGCDVIGAEGLKLDWSQGPIEMVVRSLEDNQVTKIAL